MPKSGLKVKEVAKDHFSNRASSPSVKNSRDTKAVFRIIEGSHLLASDIETGKSDPVCFVWIGPKDETPDLDTPIDARPDAGIMLTSVCPCTVDPRWDEEIVFPLECDSLQMLVNMRCLIYVRDEDINEDESVTYDELGLLEVPFKDILKNGKRMHGNTVVLSAAWYSLKKSPGMRKAEGDIKITCSLIFGNNESTKNLFGQLNSLKENKSGTLAAPPTTLTEFTEQLVNVVKPNSRPNSALRSRPGSAGRDDVSVTSSRRPMSTARSKGDGLGKKQVATLRKRTNPLMASVPIAASTGNESVISNIHQEGMESVFGGDSLAGSPMMDEARGDPFMEPIAEGDDLFAMDDVVQEDELQVIAQVKPDEDPPLGETGDELVILKGENAGDGVMGEPPDATAPIGNSEPLESTAEWLEKVEDWQKQPQEQEGGVIPMDSLAHSPASEIAATGGGAGVNQQDPKSYLQPFEKMGAPVGQSEKENPGPGDAGQSAEPPARKAVQPRRSAPEMLPPLGSMMGVPDQAVPPAMSTGSQSVSRQSSGKDSRSRERPVSAVASLQGSGNAQTMPVVSRSVQRPATATTAGGSSSTAVVKAGGNATAAARMLKELSIQRHVFQKGLDNLTAVTQQALSILTERIEKLESQGVPAPSAAGNSVPQIGNGDNIISETVSKKQTESSVKKKAPPRNVRLPRGSFKQFREQTNKRLDEAERYINTSPDRNKSYTGGGNIVEQDDYIKASTTPARMQREISKNKYDPRYHDNVPEIPVGMSRSPKAGGQGNKDSAYGGAPSQYGANDNVSRFGGNHGSTNPQQPGGGTVDWQTAQQVEQNVEADRNNNLLSKNLDWQNIEQTAVQPENSEQVHFMFEQVLNRGSHDDFVKLLKSFGPKPELLSFGMRSRTFDAIATLLMQGKSTERCLVWVLALVRTKLVIEITQHTQRSLLDGLRRTATERSRRGLLAALLESSIHNQCSNTLAGNDYGMMLSVSSPQHPAQQPAPPAAPPPQPTQQKRR